MIQYEDFECCRDLLMVSVSIRSVSGSISITSVSSMTSIARMTIARVAVARFSDHHSEEGEGEEGLRKDQMVNFISKILSYLISPGVSLCGELKLQ